MPGAIIGAGNAKWCEYRACVFQKLALTLIFIDIAFLFYILQVFSSFPLYILPIYSPITLSTAVIRPPKKQDEAYRRCISRVYPCPLSESSRISIIRYIPEATVVIPPNAPTNLSGDAAKSMNPSTAYFIRLHSDHFYSPDTRFSFELDPFCLESGPANIPFEKRCVSGILTMAFTIFLFILA